MSRRPGGDSHLVWDRQPASQAGGRASTQPCHCLGATLCTPVQCELLPSHQAFCPRLCSCAVWPACVPHSPLWPSPIAKPWITMPNSPYSPLTTAVSALPPGAVTCKDHSGVIHPPRPRQATLVQHVGHCSLGWCSLCIAHSCPRVLAPQPRPSPIDPLITPSTLPGSHPRRTLSYPRHLLNMFSLFHTAESGLH